MFRTAPLSSSFMLAGILGFFISVIYWHKGSINYSWGFTMVLFFTIIFISSLLSMRASVAKAEAERKKDITANKKKKEKQK